MHQNLKKFKKYKKELGKIKTPILNLVTSRPNHVLGKQRFKDHKKNREILYSSSPIRDHNKI